MWKIRLFRKLDGTGSDTFTNAYTKPSRWHGGKQARARTVPHVTDEYPSKTQLTSIRTGTYKLRIETGRWKRPREKECERVCQICKNGEVENEKHFVLHCTAYDDLRSEMLATIRFGTSGKYHLSLLSLDERWSVLMNPQNDRVEINEALKTYIQKATRRRLRTLNEDK